MQSVVHNKGLKLFIIILSSFRPETIAEGLPILIENEELNGAVLEVLGSGARLVKLPMMLDEIPTAT